MSVPTKKTHFSPLHLFPILPFSSPSPLSLSFSHARTRERTESPSPLSLPPLSPSLSLWKVATDPEARSAPRADLASGRMGGVPAASRSGAAGELEAAAASRRRGRMVSLRRGLASSRRTDELAQGDRAALLRRSVAHRIWHPDARHRRSRLSLFSATPSLLRRRVHLSPVAGDVDRRRRELHRCRHGEGGGREISLGRASPQYR